MRRKGFTLVEMVVVVMMLAILVAVLMPVLVTKGDTSTGPRCQNNLKQIGWGMEQYLQDHDGWFPPSSSADRTQPDPFDHAAALTWDEVIQPYIKSAEVYHCPLDPLPAPARTYAANVWVVGNGFCRPRPLPRAPMGPCKAETIPTPAVTFLFAERWNRDPERAMGRSDYHVCWEDPVQRNAEHFGGGNYAFCDGHVKWLGREQELNCGTWRWRWQEERP